MTQIEFAARIRTSQATVSRWEADGNECIPDLGDMKKIRDAAIADDLRFDGQGWCDDWFWEVPTLPEDVDV